MVSWAIRGFRFFFCDLRHTVVDYSTLPISAKQVAMPAEQSVGRVGRCVGLVASRVPVTRVVVTGFALDLWSRVLSIT